MSGDTSNNNSSKNKISAFNSSEDSYCGLPDYNSMMFGM
jgi:hypothetical protein